MIKFTDILLQIAVGLFYLISGALIFTQTSYPILVMPLFILMVILLISLKRRKRIAKYLVKEFQDLGYEIIAERPLKFSEGKITVNVGLVMVNNTPLSRYSYIIRFARIFSVKDIEGNQFELNTIVTKKWNGVNHISIEKKSTLMQTT